MIERRTIFEIHRLADEGLSQRKIARALGLSRKAVAKYLLDPQPHKAVLKRQSKLAPYLEEIKRLMEADPRASAVVIRQRLQPMGYDGGLTILRNYLATIRSRPKTRPAFIRFESEPGAQCQIDWGHFGVLQYGDYPRKVYGLAMIEAHSRLMYIEFTHSQKQADLHQAMLNAFLFFKGSPQEILSDNMINAVIERQGRIIRFNEAFLEFLRPFKIIPRACHPGAPWEKGKVEKGAIHFVKHNFWPLRTFRDLADLNAQVKIWLAEVANVRIHHTTGEKPMDRFQPQAMRPLPEFLPDCRDVVILKVHSDFSVRFDANTYSVPPWTIGKSLTLKADHNTVSIYHQDKLIAEHRRCWQRRQRIEDQRHKEAARKHKDRYWPSPQAAQIIALGQEAETFLEKIMEHKQPFTKGLKRLIALKQEYGPWALVTAMKKAATHQAFGLDYLENILYQEMTPQKRLPPLILKNEYLNQIQLEVPSLAEYDALILKRRHEHEPNPDS